MAYGDGRALREALSSTSEYTEFIPSTPPSPISANVLLGKSSRNAIRFCPLWAAWAETGFGGKMRKKGLCSGEWSDSSGLSGGCMVGASFCVGWQNERLVVEAFYKGVQLNALTTPLQYRPNN